MKTAYQTKSDALSQPNAPYDKRHKFTEKPKPNAFKEIGAPTSSVNIPDQQFWTRLRQSITKFCLTSLSTLLFSGSVLALEDLKVSFDGPTQLTSVAKLLQIKNPFAKKDVIMEGYIVYQLSQDRFIFSDGKDDIHIELDDDAVLPQGLSDKTKVRIYAEFEGGFTPELEVKQLSLVQ